MSDATAIAAIASVFVIGACAGAWHSISERDHQQSVNSAFLHGVSSCQFEQRVSLKMLDTIFREDDQQEPLP